MGLFTSILISIVASVVGVQADVTFWKTSIETAWSTVAMAPNTVWNTETYTKTAWSTYIPPAVTVSVPYTVTSVLEKDYTATVTRVVISTVTQPITITLPPTTVTIYTTSSLTGLVTCPTRVINPTYTASTALPDDYTWGCPPGTLCQPPQIGCNFEQNPPADTYYCSPDECVPIQPLPSSTPAPVKSGTCGPYPTISGYFNFDPEYFGLSYSIFVDGGDYAETCAGCAMSTIMPISQISDGQPQAPTVVPVCKVTSVALVSTISDGQPQGPVITTAARLAERADSVLPRECYDLCNQCLKVAENAGKTSKLCPPLSAAYENCEACLASHKAATKTAAAAVLQSLDPFTNYCNSVGKVGSTPPQSVILTTSSKTSPTSVPATTPSSTSLKISSTSPSSPRSASTPSSTPVTKSSSIFTQPSGTISICAVSQISDGQPQECTSIVSAVSQISDGQPQAPTSASSALATFTGAAGRTLSPPSILWSSPIGWALLLIVNALPM